MSQNNSDLMVETLESVQATGEALQKAAALADSYEREKQAAQSAIPSVVDALVSARLLQDHERDVAAIKLASHDGAIAIIGNLAKEVTRLKTAAKAVTSPGTPMVDKSASVAESSTGGHLTSNSSLVVGRRNGLGEKRASDRVFEERLGIADRLSSL